MSHDSSESAPPADDVPARLDPEVVRRRSARVRLWQNLGALVALVLAVVLLVAPLYVFGDESGAEPPVSEPRTTWDTSVDAGFPLALALPPGPGGEPPVPSADAPGAGLADWELCGTGGFGSGVEDRLGVRAGRAARELVTLADGETADALLDRITEAAAACGTWEHAERDLGDRALDLSSATTLRQVVRVGNAVLVLQHTGAWGSPEAAQVGLEQMAAASATLADELCGYAARPC